jgi:hypothetical protein
MVGPGAGRATRTTRSLGLFAAAFAIVACTGASSSVPGGLASGSASPPASGATQVSAKPTASPCPGIATSPEPLDPLPAGVEETIRAAILRRAEYGLRHDLAWVRQVAADPAATTEFGFSILAAEADSLFARNGRSFMVETLLRDHAEGPDLGGVYMDNALGGVVVVLWTSDPSAIDAAIRPHLPPCFGLLFRQVRWSEAELRRWQATIGADWDWFAEIPAAPQGVGADITENVVSIEISSANPAAADLILAHYDAPEGMIQVESDGTGAALLPAGTVVGRVLTADGRPVGSSDLMLDYGSPEDPPGACGGGDIGFGVGPDGRFEYPCQIGRRTIKLMSWAGGEERIVVSSVVVEVRQDRATEVTIRLPAGFDPLATP